MPERQYDDPFEQRLQLRLRDFGSEAVRPFDAMQITRAAIGVRGSRPAVGRSLGAWLRPVFLVGLLVVLLVVGGVAGGFIRLPTNDMFPNPSFQPFSPLPASPQPSDGGPDPSPVGSLPHGSIRPAPAPGSTAVPVATMTPASEPPSGEPPVTAIPTITPDPAPSVEPTISPTATPSAPPVVIAADAGDQVSCAIRSDGLVFCWGSNFNGALGDGTDTDRYTADVPVVGIDDAIAVSAGIRFACAVRAAGTVWCWGEDPGSDDNLTVPRQVPVIEDAVAVTAGGAHVCALRANAGIWCWGMGQLGQLGNGTVVHNTGNPVPVEVLGMDDAIQISAGWNHTCALRRDRTIWCWGGNGDGATGYGQLGDGTFENRSAPVQVVGIDDALEVAAGGWSTCAIRATGSVWCWGHGERGTLGDGNATNSASPVRAGEIDGAERVAVGFWHVCATRGDDSIWCWGDVRWGGSEVDVTTPVQGRQLLDAIGLSTDRDLLAIDAEGVLWQWGFGSTDVPVVVPVGP